MYFYLKVFDDNSAKKSKKKTLSKSSIFQNTEPPTPIVLPLLYLVKISGTTHCPNGQKEMLAHLKTPAYCEFEINEMHTEG